MCDNFNFFSQFNNIIVILRNVPRTDFVSHIFFRTVKKKKKEKGTKKEEKHIFMILEQF